VSWRRTEDFPDRFCPYSTKHWPSGPVVTSVWMRPSSSCRPKNIFCSSTGMPPEYRLYGLATLTNLRAGSSTATIARAGLSSTWPDVQR